MDIIIDTREQKPLKFTGHKTTRRKLDEGDYNTIELEPYIVIERKSLQDLYGSIIQGHERFKAEIMRSKAKNKEFYIFLEGTIKKFVEKEWSLRYLSTKPEILSKILKTMQEKYEITIIECNTRDEMSKKIIELIEKIEGEKNGYKQST